MIPYTYMTITHPILQNEDPSDPSTNTPRMTTYVTYSPVVGVEIDPATCMAHLHWQTISSQRLSNSRYTYVGNWNQTPVVAQRHRWDPILPQFMSIDSCLSCTGSKVDSCHRRPLEHRITLWINELNVAEAANTGYIGPFSLHASDQYPILGILQWTIRRMQFPPSTAMFVYHGTSYNNACQIWNRATRSTATPKNTTDSDILSLSEFSANEIDAARTYKNVPMCGDHWVYTTRDYLKAKRYAFMDSSQNIHSSGGAIVRLIMPLPLDPRTVHYMGRMPFPCSCARCVNRDKEAILPWRVDHTNEAYKQFFSQNGIVQLWMDTETLKQSEYMGVSWLFRLDTIWTIVNELPRINEHFSNSQNNNANPYLRRDVRVYNHLSNECVTSREVAAYRFNKEPGIE